MKKVLYLIASICIASLAFYAGKWHVSHDGEYFKRVYVSQRKAMLLSQAAQTRVSDVLLLGDSLVDGMFVHSQNQLVFLAGIGMATVGDWISFAPKLLEKLAPRTVIIAIGINDTQKATGITLNAFMAKYEALSSLFSAHGVEVVLSSLLPVERGKPLGDAMFDTQLIAAINRSIRELAMRAGYGFLDSHALLVGPDGFLPKGLSRDGVHLTGEGYRRWKQVLFPE